MPDDHATDEALARLATMLEGLRDDRGAAAVVRLDADEHRVLLDLLRGNRDGTPAAHARFAAIERRLDAASKERSEITSRHGDHILLRTDVATLKETVAGIVKAREAEAKDRERGALDAGEFRGHTKLAVALFVAILLAVVSVVARSFGATEPAVVEEGDGQGDADMDAAAGGQPWAPEDFRNE